jgi:hypothetical protein
LNQSGPTTEAGKQKKLEKEAARAEKEDRRREKNRKKRQAYRTRQRERKGIWNESSKGRNEWSRERRTKEKQKNKKEQRDKQRRREEGEWQRWARGEAKKQEERRWKAPKNETEWEARMAVALEERDFEVMKCLFQHNLTRVAGQSGHCVAKHDITKRFRILSARFHPDKHAGDESYKVAFQALNGARDALAF